MTVYAPRGLNLITLLAALALAAACDVRSRRIPNSLVLTIAVGGAVHAVVTGGLASAMASILGMLAGVALMYFQFHRGLMGAGDVKLLGAIGAWTGPLGAVYTMLLGSLVGGVLSLAALCRVSASERARVTQNLISVAVLRRLELPEPSQLSRERGIPFGVALAMAGAALAVLGPALGVLR